MRVCATGLLGLRLGIPIEDLELYTYHEDKIIRKYGINRKRVIETWGKNWIGRPKLFNSSVAVAIWKLNDDGWTLDQIADFLDSEAKRLEKQ